MTNAEGGGRRRQHGGRATWARAAGNQQLRNEALHDAEEIAEENVLAKHDWRERERKREKERERERKREKEREVRFLVGQMETNSSQSEKSSRKSVT